jgi:para-aminobenzoate synthetase component 1
MALPWCAPEDLVPRLAARHGLDGLSWLDGDGSRHGRHAIVGLRPVQTILCRGLPGQPGARDPFAALAAMHRRGGTWLAWLAYEAAAWVEPAPHWHCPDLALLRACRYDPLLRFDLQERRLSLEGSAAAVRSWRPALEAGLAEAAGAGGRRRPGDRSGEPRPASWRWLTPPEQFGRQVARIRALIAAGDLFQANLTACRECRLPRPPSPLELYLRLRRHCPAPFSGLMVQGREAVLSTSMERFLRVAGDGAVEARPIKGTRPRHRDPGADAAAAADLISSVKDRAENVMIVDLIRNDLGRLCRPGSIHVPQLVGLESYARVHHLTSVIEGRLRQDRTAVDLLRAAWPPGSISGAPKIRACRRLSELEPCARGPYCGSFLLLDGDGGLDSNVLIRTVMVRGDTIRAHAGCGIVADSDPAAETRELGWKLDPLLEALA